MLSKTTEKAAIQPCFTIVLQAVVLFIDTLLFAHGVDNGFIIISGALVLSLFGLQVVSRRFLFLFPFQSYLGQPIPKIDTTILRFFLILALSFTGIGAIGTNFEYFKVIDTFLRSNLFWLVPILIPVLPLLWHLVFNDLVRQSFINDMKKRSLEYHDQCPNPDCDNRYASFIRTLKSSHTGQVAVECRECGGRFEFKEPIDMEY
jgi:hypothetical protein